MAKVKKILCIFVLSGIFLFSGSANLGATAFSPAYRVKSLVDEEGRGYQGIAATLVLPQQGDIKGVGETGAAYNYLGIETSSGESLEIGLHKDGYDKEHHQWSVFSMASYNGAYANYGSDYFWHNFRTAGNGELFPNMVFPDGSLVEMSLYVEDEDQVIFEISGFAPIRLIVPGADPDGEKQVWRRVTSLMTDDPLGYSKNNNWQEVKIKKSEEPWQVWLPESKGTLSSNNMDKNDPNDTWVTVRTSGYYPETVDIIALEGPQAKSVFKEGEYEYYLNGEKRSMDAQPFIKEGRVYLPVRFLGYACGLKEEEISWDSAANEVTLASRGIQEILTVGDNKLSVNNVLKEMDVTPLLQEGRVYIPARFVAEAFGFYVEWNPLYRTVSMCPSGEELPENPFN